MGQALAQKGKGDFAGTGHRWGAIWAQICSIITTLAGVGVGRGRMDMARRLMHTGMVLFSFQTCKACLLIREIILGHGNLPYIFILQPEKKKKKAGKD